MTFEQTKTMIFLNRHLPGGKQQIVQCEMGVLEPRHEEQSIALHDRVAKGLSGTIYLPSDHSDIVRYLNGDGLTIGVWYENRLICARTVKTNHDWIEEALGQIEEPADPKQRTALTGYVVVDKDFRGNNVQFLSYYMMENLLSPDFDMLLTTVSPKNVFSLTNVMHCGYYITDLRNLYGEYLRYILRKKIRNNKPVWTNWHQTVSIRDVARQQQALQRGNVGYKIIRRLPGVFILYGHLGEDAPQDNWRFRPRPPLRLL